MELTKRQQDILDGKEGDVKAKIMKTLVMYGETFGSERMVDITGKYGYSGHILPCHVFKAG